jgi:hypothetical protein
LLSATIQLIATPLAASVAKGVVLLCSIALDGVATAVGGGVETKKGCNQRLQPFLSG